MRKTSCIWLAIFLLGTISSAAQRGEGKSAGEQFLGTWAGTWEGAGSGGIELTLEKNKDAAIAGRVSVTGEPTYKATFKSIAFEDATMTAKYDFPPDEAAEVVLTATFDRDAATGTWLLRERSSGGEVAAGTWSAKRK